MIISSLLITLRYQKLKKMEISKIRMIKIVVEYLFIKIYLFN